MISSSDFDPAWTGQRPAGASVVLPGFDNPGELDAYVYRPAVLAPGAALVVTLHGCTQSGPAYARDAGWLELADRAGFVVLAPGQRRANNPNLCFNWYSDDHAGPDGREIRSILAMIDATIRMQDLDSRRVFVTGLSAGAAMAFALICRHPQVFAGAGIIAGLPAGRANSLPEALALMKGRQRAARAKLSPTVSLAPAQAPTVSIWQGLEDQMVVPSNADAIAAQWAELAGLSLEPTSNSRSGRLARATWIRADGATAMEVNKLAGFGHAVPLDTARPQGVGHRAPHMVDCGLSSTLSLAAQWGLASHSAAAPADSHDHPGRVEHLGVSSGPRAFGPSDLPPGGRATGSVAVPGLRSGIMANLNDRVPSGVRDLIDRALHQAGL